MASVDTAEIMIYGRIGGSFWDDGVTSADMAEQLRDITVPNIHVRINSGGGDVFEGVAIHTQLRRHAATVTTFVDGLAASAASFIAQAGDRVVIARNAMMMIHDGMTGTYGGPKAHRLAMELLDKVSDNIADLYAARAGEDAEYWRNLMTVNDEDGTWYTGQEAVDAGLADEVTDPDEDDASATARNLRKWSNVLPERVRSTLSNEQEQESVETSPEQESGEEQEQTSPTAPDSTPDSDEETSPDSSEGNSASLEHEDPDVEQNALEDSTSDEDFRFAMQMAHWRNTTPALLRS
jgi:ATP-dependent protease ClpP protease subunit